jgi:hypothetical protein
MKKLLILLFAFALFSFNTQNEKKVTITFSVEEIQTVYDALGELPAKKVEALRMRIALEANKQLADTTKK